MLAQLLDVGASDELAPLLLAQPELLSMDFQRLQGNSARVMRELRDINSAAAAEGLE